MDENEQAVVNAIGRGVLSEVAPTELPTAQVPGTIGDDGFVSRPGFSVHLPTGWMDLSHEPDAAARFPDAVLILSDTDGDGVLVLTSERDRSIITEVRQSPGLRSREFGRAAGELVLQVTRTAGGDSPYQKQLVLEHSGDSYLLELTTSPEGHREDDRALAKILLGWRWR